MSKEKQIEEMAIITSKSMQEWVLDLLPGSCPAFVAKRLYNAGYRKQSEWISVEDALPQPFKFVLYYGKDTMGLDYVNWDGKWSISTATEPEEVTHWMPLPEPPKMEGEE